MHRILDFTELKAYIDIFNEKGHKGFDNPINPFQYWNYKKLGKVDDNIHTFIDDGLIIILELSERVNIANILIFALSPQKRILQKLIDICRNYSKIIFNSERGNKYDAIARKFDGLHYIQNGKHYYTLAGSNDGSSQSGD
jgi:uncharacterized protein (UPF0262 family)